MFASEMESKNLITIIIPCYKSEKYLLNLFYMFKNQTINTFNVIFVYQNSDDDSLNKLKDEVNKYPNYKIVKSEMIGLSNARNLGLSYATTKYVYFLDADDYIGLDFVEVMQKLCIENEFDVCLFESKRTKRNKINFKCSINKNYKIVDDRNVLLTDFISGKYLYNVWNKIYSLTFLKKIDVFPNLFQNDIFYAEDVFFGIDIYCKAAKVLITKNMCHYYYKNNKGMVYSSYANTKLDSLKGISRYFGKFDDELINNYINSLACFLSVEQLFRMITSHYKVKKDYMFAYSFYKQYVKYLKYCKKFKWYIKLFFPLIKPIIYIYSLFLNK